MRSTGLRRSDPQPESVQVQKTRHSQKLRRVFLSVGVCRNPLQAVQKGGKIEGKNLTPYGYAGKVKIIPAFLPELSSGNLAVLTDSNVYR